MAAKKKYYYAVLNKDHKLILEDHKLPFYYNRKVAQGVSKKFVGSYVLSLDYQELIDHLQEVIQG
jgi:hypothetical protein